MKRDIVLCIAVALSIVASYAAFVCPPPSTYFFGVDEIGEEQNFNKGVISEELKKIIEINDRANPLPENAIIKEGRDNSWDITVGGKIIYIIKKEDGKLNVYKLEDLYRVVYLHVPVAWVCYLAFALSLVASIAFLTKRKHAYDSVAEVSAILGLVYGAIALVSGSIWAKAAWGSYWNWDPRETTTLILWIAYAGYISIRHSIGEVEKRGVIGAVYNILAFFTIPLSYLSILMLPTLHPILDTPTKISPMIGTLILSLIAATIFFIYLLLTTLNVWSLEDRVNALIYEKGGI